MNEQSIKKKIVFVLFLAQRMDEHQEASQILQKHVEEMVLYRGEMA